MGCVVSCVQKTTMSLFGRTSSSSTTDMQTKIERKLYLAKESPEPEFDLSECELQQVPSGIYLCCRVYRKENLYLHMNKLQSLDGGGTLSDLYLIKVLNISCNKLKQLPNNIKYLVNLTELHVQENLLEYIPDVIGDLQSLRILDISKNKLKKLTPLLGKLINLRKLMLTGNIELTQLCSQLCYATNVALIELDAENFTYPPSYVTIGGTEDIMKYLCDKCNVPYNSPSPIDSDLSSALSPTSVIDPFKKNNTKTWEEHEATFIEQENKYHEAAKHQREIFLSKVLEGQQELDNEVAKVQETKERMRQTMIRVILKDEKEIEFLINKFIQPEDLKPEILRQQLAYDLTEHDRLLEIVRQNYDNVKKSEVLKAMEMLIEEDYSIQHSKKQYDNTLSTVKQSMLMQELEGNDKLTMLLQAKDQSHSDLVHQLLEDQDVQKVLVGSLMERTDAKTWSLNEEISIISTNLAKLSSIEQDKKRLRISFNYNDLLEQRVLLVNLLDDLFEQQSRRRHQLINTLKEMEEDTVEKSKDFWLKNYQKLIDSAPKDLLNAKHLDPLFANELVQHGVIHCLPFLVKFLFSDGSLLDITHKTLKDSGIILSSDRENILNAINSFIEVKNTRLEYQDPPESQAPSAPQQEVVEQNCTGVVTANELKDSVYVSECVICMDASCEAVFVPCGHMCCCLVCSKKDMNCCPICRGEIERTIQVRVA